MIKWIKSYLAFMSLPARLLIFAGMPAAVTVTLLCLPSLDFPADMCVAAILLMTMECFLDYWVFGGIAAKGGSRMAYLMSAPGKMGILRKALTVSMLRQILESGVILGLWGAVSAVRKGDRTFDEGQFWVFAGILLLEYLFIILSLTAARLFDGLWIHLTISCIGAAAMAMALGPVLRRSAVSFWLLLLLAPAVSLVSVSAAMKRVKENYYDRQD
ncbi:MAG: hypothetical protein K2O06_03175 [Acetatifactor sp.]|nr:hypothetical protein [Acetatifactor sp.]